jgi:DNA replicative helicase MCM subunit Mcm2 (Cdc46/Mcm family)
MSEASAKTRLSEFVERIDVERAITIYEEAMRFTATDPITGEIDTDRTTGGTSQAGRDYLAIVKELRVKMFEKTEKWPSRMELTRYAEDNGVPSGASSYAVQQLWTELGLLTFV